MNWPYEGERAIGLERSSVASRLTIFYFISLLVMSMELRDTDWGILFTPKLSLVEICSWNNKKKMFRIA